MNEDQQPAPDTGVPMTDEVLNPAEVLEPAAPPLDHLIHTVGAAGGTSPEKIGALKRAQLEPREGDEAQAQVIAVVSMLEGMFGPLEQLLPAEPAELDALLEQGARLMLAARSEGTDPLYVAAPELP